MTYALVMCGGQGTRMKGEAEKPLLPVAGAPIIARVLGALRKSDKIDRILAATTPSTPQTKRYLTLTGTEVLDTPGYGYSLDLSFALGALRPERVFVISADMPLITSRTVDKILSVPQRKPLLSVVLKTEFVRAAGVKPSVTFHENGTEYCHAGISVFDTSKFSTDTLIKEQEFLVLESIEVAVNVNTKEELRLAEKLLIQRA